MEGKPLGNTGVTQKWPNPFSSHMKGPYVTPFATPFFSFSLI